jgi:hypothetical protein
MNQTLLYQYEAVRASGLTNMFDTQAVHKIAEQCQFTELAQATLTPQHYSNVIVELADAYSAEPVGNTADYQAWFQRTKLEHSTAKMVLADNS